MGRILFFEDSPTIRSVITNYLRHHEIKTLPLPASSEQFEDDNVNLSTLTSSADLILIDTSGNLPTAFSLLGILQSDERLRKIPVICLSERLDITSKITAFSLGADDFLSQPFDPLDLRARVDSKINKVSRHRQIENVLIFKEIKIDQSSHRVIIQPTKESSNEVEEVFLTQTEFKILVCFAKHPNHILSRNQLINLIWGENSSVRDRAVDVHICSLRKKLGLWGKRIKAVPGAGYQCLEIQPD